MSKSVYTPEEIIERQKKQRTILNWKKQFNVRIPLAYFDEFKLNKKHYLACAKLNPVLVDMFLRAEDDGAQNIIIQTDLEIIP